MVAFISQLSLEIVEIYPAGATTVIHPQQVLQIFHLIGFTLCLMTQNLLEIKQRDIALRVGVSCFKHISLGPLLVSHSLVQLLPQVLMALL